MRKIKNLNEELARWTFEVLCRSSSEWDIAFTNPTAGPWKTIKAPSKNTGAEGEVYRFTLEEERPDIIMYNDSLETAIIFEAKDSLKKLIFKDQAIKSADVVVKLANILGSKGSNEFWKGRENYKVVLGLLWGSTDKPEEDDAKNKVYDRYHTLVENKKAVFSDVIIGVEALYKDGEIQCKSFCKSYNSKSSSFGARLVSSLIKQ